MATSHMMVAMAKKKLFHVSRDGFGSYTWCWIRIPPFGSFERGPDWGSSTPYEATTCKKCILNFIRETTYDLAAAADQLAKLELKNGK